MADVKLTAKTAAPSVDTTDILYVVDVSAGIGYKMTVQQLLDLINAGGVDFTPDGDIVATDVQAAIVEVRDDTDTKLAGKASTSHTHTKADLTDIADFLLESEVDTDIKTLVLPANVTISAFIATLLDDASASAARTTLDVDQAGTDNSTDVTLTGTPDYITIAGQVITVNQIDLTTDVTGDLPVTEGGTGASDAATARTNLGVDLTKSNNRLVKAVAVESPTGTEDISLFFTDDAITIEQMNAVLRGSATPSVTWTVRHATDRSLTGNEVVTSGTTTTSTTTGSEVTSFNDATIPAGSWVWLETTAQSGTVDELNLAIEYTVD